jgi:serine/threonine protein phosphatase PrpC
MAIAQGGADWCMYMVCVVCVLSGTVGVCSYYGIFDGHGGAGAAQYCAQSLHKLLALDVGGLLNHPSTALAKAFRHADDEVTPPPHT